MDSKTHELTVKAPRLREIQGPENEPFRKKIIPLDGRLITAEDPLIVGKNFRTLTNMRYCERSIKSIGGMTKINTSVLDATYLKARNAFQFRKVQPAETTTEETHVLAQAWNTGLTASKVFENTTAPPAQGNFSATAVWEDSSGAGVGRFSDAPNGMLAYCNGVDTCLWGGDGAKPTSFITSTAAVTDTPTNPREYCDVITNTKQDSANVAQIGGEIDSYTVLCLHCDGSHGSTTFTDSSAVGHTVTANGDAAISTTNPCFGSGCGTLDGTEDYLSIPDHASWSWGTDPFEVDTRIYFKDLPAEGERRGLWGQWQDNMNWILCCIGMTSGFYYVELTIDVAGSVTQILNHGLMAPSGGFKTNTYYHLAVIRGWGGDSTKWVVTIDGRRATSIVTSSVTMPNLTGNFLIGLAKGAGIDIYGKFDIDEFRISKGVPRWTAAFSPPARAYSAAARTWLVRSPLPIQGGKIYIPSGMGNTESSTLTIKEWNGGGWDTLTVTDNTASGGVALYQTGTFSFASTVSTSKLKIIESGLGYWYQFSIDAGEVQIYHMTLDIPFQAFQDIPDGIDADVAAFFKYTTIYTDYTTNVREDYYDSADAASYASLSSLGAFNSGTGANCVMIGFFNPQAAINLAIPSGKMNATAGTLSLDAWDGTDWLNISNVVDGTAEGGAPIAKPGIITYSIPTQGQLFPRTLSNNSVPLYYYRLRSSGAMSADTAIYHVCGTPAPKAILGYKFPLYSQDCLMLCCNMDGKRNSVLVSAPDSAQVFNGDESFEVEFGTEEEINCGCTIFSQYGSNLFNITMFFKDREIWNLVRGTDGWTKYRVSNSNGCPAPLTLDTVIIPPIEGRSQDNRCIAIWEDFDGVYISEGRHPVCVSDDIRDLWDQTSTTKINLSYLGSHYGRVDQAKMEYHLFVATTAGSITTLDDEWVLDLRRWKWFHVDRTTGLKIQCAVSVKDAYGASYSYGFIDTGYMERLEYGNTFDGQNIVSTFQTGDFPLVEDDFLVENEIKALVPVMRAKETTTADATFTVYTDTYKTGTDYTADPTLSNYRLTMPVKGANTAPGVIHSIKGTMTTSNETTGFEPFVIGVYYQPVREHDYT